MADVVNEVCLHIVQATWDREPLLTPEARGLVYRQIVAKAKEHRCRVLAVGGVEDHVHVVVGFPTAVTIMKLVQDMKGASSHLASHHDGGKDRFFKWQASYSVFPVEPENLTRVVRYVECQEEHHQNRTTEALWERTFRPKPTKPES